MLYLYKEISPNLDKKHYYFTTIAQYKNALVSNLVKSITLDNYRINTNIIKVALDSTITETIADKLTYAIDEREDENHVITYFRCYHVNRIVIQSGYVTLYCSVDLWASYLYKATISNLIVNRCNRNIGVGLLDEIAGTKGEATRSYCATTDTSNGPSIPNQLMARNKVYIVFALKYNIEQNNAGSVSQISLCAFNLQTLATALYNANYQAISDSDSEEVKAQKRQNNFNYSIVNPVDFAIDVVSGIYGIVGTNGWGGSGTLNAVVIGVWFADHIVTKTGTSSIQIKSKANWHNFTDVTITPLEVARYEVNKTLTITNDFNKQFYIGTMQNGLKLQRTTQGTINVIIKIIPANDKLKVIAYQGDNQQDITEAFSTTTGTTDGDVTAERQTLEIVQNSIKYIGAGLAIAKGVKAGGIASVIAYQGGASAVVGSLERSGHIGSIVNGGDGALSYWRNFTGMDTTTPTSNLATPITNPYMINAYESINDEKANARINGASFSELTTFASVFSASLLGTGTLSDTYIKATCNVENIPTDAIDLIKSKLQNGIYLVNLTT